MKFSFSFSVSFNFSFQELVSSSLDSRHGYSSQDSAVRNLRSVTLRITKDGATSGLHVVHWS